MEKEGKIISEKQDKNGVVGASGNPPLGGVALKHGSVSFVFITNGQFCFYSRGFPHTVPEKICNHLKG
ncbi:hypothetical protein LJC24_00880 [Desulfococcaceae bacterium OttesenSCG-928-F15]|nr:hypothetical protein [Desulfococcaceae bacterium OttesenSCG-928-F15]